MTPQMRAATIQLTTAYGAKRVRVQAGVIKVRSEKVPTVEVEVVELDRGFHMRLAEYGIRLDIGGPVSVSSVVRATENTLKLADA